jgi:hypothetical protein
VPEGYTAYYTLDGSDPSLMGASTYEYTDAIAIGNGQTMFTAVLKNNRTGKFTRQTKRNYVLDLEE